MRRDSHANDQVLRYTCILAIVTFGFTFGSVLAGPPVPVFLDTEPGLFVPFEGDPDDPNTWNYKPIEWGNEGHIHPKTSSWELVDSPFSDAGAICRGNVLGPNHPNDSVLPCINPTRRYRNTFKNQPPPGSGTAGGQPMDDTKDWVLSLDFRIEIPAGDSYGNDKFFEVSAHGDVLKLRGANTIGPGQYSSFLPDGTPDRYLLVHGTGVPGEETNTLIDVPLSEGKMTVHYKASNQRIDLWHDNTLLVKNFQAIRGDYTARAIQLGGGGASLEHTLWDNVFFGVGAIPGDANGDGVVDVADLGVLGANFNQSNKTFSDGDFNDDGIVDVSDLGILGANWTASQATGNASSLVPEPTTLSLLAMSVLMVGRRRR